LVLRRSRHIVAVRAQSPSLNGVIIFGSKIDGVNASALNGISCAKVERVAESKGAPNALSVGNLHPPSIAYYRHKAKLADGISEGIVSSVHVKSKLHRRVTVPGDY
jgi:hypothetical protein